MSLARAGTRTARSVDERTNHEAVEESRTKVNEFTVGLLDFVCYIAV